MVTNPALPQSRETRKRERGSAKRGSPTDLYRIVEIAELLTDVSVRNDKAIMRSTLQRAADRLCDAHRAIGQMFAARTGDELAVAVAEFVAIARDLALLVSRFQRAMLARQQRVVLLDAIASLRTHPLAADLRHTGELGLEHGAGSIVRQPTAYDPLAYVFPNNRGRPAFDLCVDHLDKVVAFFDLAKHELG